MPQDSLAASYNQIAQTYLASRPRLKSNKYLQKLLKLLPKQSSILDLGCGAGVPVDDLLLKAGHEVIGLDISPVQIDLARRYCPKGQYLVQDIQTLRASEYQVDAVIALYTLFHVPRTKQLALLTTIASFLPKGGLLLVTMGDREFEGSHESYGATLWSSQYGTAKNRAMVVQAGFRILLDEMDTSGGERHQIILAEKT